jgi:2-hydroxy-3-oxopropionate reductase
VLGEDGILEGAKPDTILVDMSSIAPLVSIEISGNEAEKGIVMLEPF